MEANFDSLIGQTHNYAGLSYGNIASFLNQQKESNPKEAALQGLLKMKALADRGFLQGVLPPHERPFIEGLRAIGFSGDINTVLKKAQKEPEILANYSSASAMWAANAATISPSKDTFDGKLHITPANLISNLHRSLETETTTQILRTLFSDKKFFIVHDPLPKTGFFSDEGAANHGRLAPSSLKEGIEIFVYGEDGKKNISTKYPCRQTLQAAKAIARRHGLNPEKTFFLQQNPKAINAGCFHNDVISVANETVFLYHEEAFLSPLPFLKDLPYPIKVSSSQLSLNDAVSSYLFNSQILTKKDGSMLLVAPQECQEILSAKNTIDAILQEKYNPINELLTVDLRQSMQNGGGPACLRLRIVLTEEEKNAVKGRVFLDEILYQELKSWIKKYYRDKICSKDLFDPSLVQECYQALDELTKILEIPPIYSFQKRGFI